MKNHGETKKKESTPQKKCNQTGGVTFSKIGQDSIFGQFSVDEFLLP